MSISLDFRSIHQPMIQRFADGGSVGFEDRMKVEIYKQLFRLNRGFDEILTALAALRQHPAFPASELDRFTAVSKETRASTNSFLTAILEVSETAVAGRRYRKRRRQEQQDDQQA